MNQLDWEDYLLSLYCAVCVIVYWQAEESGSENEGDGLEKELRVRALKSMQAAHPHEDDNAISN